ncbi:MAG TPA: bifunctional DNA-binding transcriptional regulator/O6-methylguanine-DNA methyltransferase Ada [Methylophilaceae bacterium]|nr:bifunctional DNA-binding transcriptional regulator/O6-methylguanine-DNA methyltransferase Ada [Methylophilaceae bacterium]
MGTEATDMVGRSSDDQQARWAAVASRDRSADGKFYYSVKTTGIYCRPSCPARTPRRENVQFHESAAAAEQAGFRPCKRCRPESGVTQRHAAIIAAACRFIEQAEKPPTLVELSEYTGLSPSHLQRLFKALTGLSPKEYGVAQRANRMRQHLPQSRTVTEAINEAGYGSGSRFYESSNQWLGMTPTRYRSGGAGTTIRFALGQCSLGAILVASSEVGICSILLGDDAENLVRDLQDRFPQADLIGDDQEYEKVVARVVGFMEAPQLGLDLPLDIRGTAFQHRVWQALIKIPPGTTATYAEIARSLGMPNAARAVASACAANPLAVAIPCHRVIRRDGNLSGYRWGVDRKRLLLEREAG